MNYLRLSLAAGALILTLAIPTFAGEIHTTIASPPPPVTGEMHTGAAAETSDMETAVAEVALNIVQGILSLV
jgi:hypothetical protein